MYITGYIIIKSKKDLLYIITLFISSSIIPAIVGYIQLFNGAGLYTNPGFENRIAGTFGHPNVLGYSLHDNYLCDAQDEIDSLDFSILEPYDIAGHIIQCPFKEGTKLFDVDTLVQSIRTQA
jgi:hypothetical protein